MSDSPAAIRLEELLVEQTDRDLTYEESLEVQKLLRQTQGWQQDDIELAAAAALVAFTAERGEPLMEMPASLREKIAQQAEAHRLLEHDEPRRAPERGDTVRKEIPEGAKVMKEAARPARSDDRAEVADSPATVMAIPLASRSKIWIAGMAIAASIAVAVLGYWFIGLRAETPSRGALLAEAKDAVTLPWSPAGDPLGAGTSGDVVWSDTAQAGFMRFVGLPRNDATKSQYQLWIFDAERDDRYPVDGGVFDVNNETGEVIVAIDPKIRVNKATMFAVTVERPGGVVVSTRERLVVLAKVI